MTNIRMTLLASVVVFTLAGCQSTSEPVSLTQETNHVEQSVETQFAEVDQVYQSWLEILKDSDNLALYSPTHFRQLADAWLGSTEVYKQIESEPALIKKDYSLFSSKSYKQVFEENIAKVDTSYRELQGFKLKADNALADAIAQMVYLDSIATVSYFPSDYKKVDADYRSLFIDVRDDKLESAQEKQVKFLAKAKLLEVKVNHKIYIEPLEKQAAVLKKEGLSRVAPLTFDRVEGEITLATNVVSTNPRDTQSVQNAVKRVEFELKHVAQVAHQVKLLAAIEDNKFEPIVLEMENNLFAISQKIDGSDYRDTMLREQAERILTSVEGLVAADKTNALKEQLSALTLKVETLEADNKKQVEALAQASAREQQLQQQKTRDEQYIRRMDELVASLKQLQVTPENKTASEVEVPVSTSTPVENTSLSEPSALQIESAAQSDAS
ncbi:MULTISPECIES: DNA repair protein [Vibrio]|uniref:DNA repair protein n=1 Tax=Vibrio TaxID=662 RepID=UPI000C9DD759|nr:DNA repair protein [Vibrio diazotrophicus]PNH94926.1 DNA repair protein [Vibrio diazotrophicus]